MPFLRKATPGTDSFGHQWPEPGAVVEVTPDEATALLAIPDGGFAEVEPPAEPAVEDPEDDPETRFSEVAADQPVAEPPKARRRTPKAKAAAEDPAPIEE